MTHSNERADVFQQMAERFIAELDRTHPALTEVDFDRPARELIGPVAAALRSEIITPPIDSLAPNAILNLRIAEPDESPEQLVERCLAGRWRSVGFTYALPPETLYTVSPDASQNTLNLPFGEWTWQVNRHDEWVIAALLYHQRHEIKYAQAVAGWLSDWLFFCPRPATDENARQGPWRTIEIGIRLGHRWPKILAALKNAPEIDDVLLLACLQSIAEQADFVWEFRKRNNWLLMELLGLLSAGVMLPFHTRAATWRQNAENEFIRQLQVQFHADGLQVELSPDYHSVCVLQYLSAIDMLRRAGEDIPQSFYDALQNMYEPWRKLARPDGRVFGFQDSGDIILAKWLERLPEELRLPSDAFFLTGDGPTPERLHDLLPNAGYAVMRSGWGPEAVSVVFDGGPYGDGHQHEDKLSIQLTAFGEDIIGEAGKVDYADTPERRYSLTSLAHSTAIVDGLGQNRREFYTWPDSLKLNATAKIECRFDSDMPQVQARYDEGYGPGATLNVTHTRTVAMAESDLLLIRDRFEATDGQPHAAEIIFHLMKEPAELDGLRLVTRSAGANLGVTPKMIHGDNMKALLTTGGETPDLRGWAQEPKNAYTGRLKLAPRPCLTIKTGFTDIAEVVTAIRVFAPGETPVAPSPNGDDEILSRSINFLNKKGDTMDF